MPRSSLEPRISPGLCNVGAEEEERVNLTYDADLTKEMGGNGKRKLIVLIAFFLPLCDRLANNLEHMHIPKAGVARPMPTSWVLDRGAKKRILSLKCIDTQHAREKDGVKGWAAWPGCMSLPPGASVSSSLGGNVGQNLEVFS